MDVFVAATELLHHITSHHRHHVPEYHHQSLIVDAEVRSFQADRFGSIVASSRWHGTNSCVCSEDQQRGQSQHGVEWGCHFNPSPVAMSELSFQDTKDAIDARDFVFNAILLCLEEWFRRQQFPTAATYSWVLEMLSDFASLIPARYLHEAVCGQADPARRIAQWVMRQAKGLGAPEIMCLANGLHDLNEQGVRQQLHRAWFFMMYARYVHCLHDDSSLEVKASHDSRQMMNLKLHLLDELSGELDRIVRYPPLHEFKDQVYQRYVAALHWTK